MITVLGSYGALKVAEDGTVLSYDHQGNTPEDGDYSDIVRVNIEEYKATYPDEDHDEMDILDIGFWTDKGVYESPEPEFREMVATQKGN